MNKINFENICQEIQKKYEELGHNLGWSFLTTSKNTIKKNSSIALITLNPGGEEKSEPVMRSFEDGNAYLNEEWKKNLGVGKAPLQIQIQYLFKHLTIKHPRYNNFENLMNDTLMGYFIPFRSPTIKELINSKLSRKFSHHLWSRLLIEVDLSLIICIDKNTFFDINEIFHETKGFKLAEKKEFNTGWGNIKAELTRYNGEKKDLTIARLPHLSRYKIFNREKSQAEIEIIINEMTLGLR